MPSTETDTTEVAESLSQLFRRHAAIKAAKSNVIAAKARLKKAKDHLIDMQDMLAVEFEGQAEKHPLFDREDDEESA